MVVSSDGHDGASLLERQKQKLTHIDLFNILIISNDQNNIKKSTNKITLLLTQQLHKNVVP